MGQELVKGLVLDRISNGPSLLKLHYVADPDKDPSTEKGKEWVKAAAQVYPDGGVMSPGWRREMEMDPTAGSGELALPFFDSEAERIIVQNYVPTESDTLFAGLDVGLHNPTAMIVVAVQQNGRAIPFWEFYEKNVLLNRMAEAIKSCPYYERLQWIACDPTIWNENQYTRDGMTSLARMLFEDVPDHLRIHKMMKGHERSDMRFIAKLSMMIMSPAPEIKISRECSNLIKELRGLRYVETVGDKNAAERLVDKNNHLCDALKYCLLSHPEIKNMVHRHAYGTIGHLNETHNAAEEVSRETGRDFQDAFNDLYF